MCLNLLLFFPAAFISVAVLIKRATKLNIEVAFIWVIIQSSNITMEYNGNYLSDIIHFFNRMLFGSSEIAEKVDFFYCLWEQVLYTAVYKFIQ